jgi:hypothetical protein
MDWRDSQKGQIWGKKCFAGFISQIIITKRLKLKKKILAGAEGNGWACGIGFSLIYDTVCNLTIVT